MIYQVMWDFMLIWEGAELCLIFSIDAGSRGLSVFICNFISLFSLDFLKNFLNGVYIFQLFQ